MVPCVVRVTALLRDVMDHDYGGAIKRKLDDVYRTAPPTAGARGAEKTERELRQAFIVRCTLLVAASIANALRRSC